MKFVDEAKTEVFAGRAETALPRSDAKSLFLKAVPTAETAAAAALFMPLPTET